MTEFLARLRQRKLVQSAIAYTAGAWAVLQVLDLVAQEFDWPGVAMRTITVLLGVGFFAALVLAWYHGERGAQRVGGIELLMLAALLVIAGVAVSWVRHRRNPTPAASVAHAAPASTAIARPGQAPALPAGATPINAQPIPAKSIAVLPFENLSTDKANAYFADGMQDLILTKLADIGDLKVISRTTTEKYASHPEDLKAIGLQLGVATVLEGSVQKAGNDVLINVQLIDAKTDGQIWAQSYQRTLDNIFGVEGEVAQKVAEALNATLTEKENAAVARVPTSNKQAYQDYLKAIYFLDNTNRSGDGRDLERSVALSRQAVAADPDFEEAWALLALGYQKLGNHEEDLEHAARRALELKPDDADAHLEYAFALMNQRKFDEAIAEAREAAHLDPEDVSVRYGLGVVYAAAGRLDEAAAVFEGAVRARPHASFGRKWIARIAMQRRDYAAARDQLELVTASDPGDAVAAYTLARAQILGWGDLDAARRALQVATTPVVSSGVLSDAWFWQSMRQRDYPAALRIIAAAPSTWFGQQATSLWLYKAQAWRAAGDTQQAQAAFARARDQLRAQIASGDDRPDLHANLALALAGLGDARAGDEMQHAIRTEDVFSASDHQLDLAVVEAWTGRSDAALAQLDKLLGKPAGDVVSVASLKLDPTWDGLRTDPRFQALLKKYGDVRPAAASSGAAQ